LVAAADTDDANHSACKALLERDHGPLVTTPMVIAETTYLLDRQLGPRAEVALFASVTDGMLRVGNLQADDWARIGELVATYADLRLGSTGASLIAVAERLTVTHIATLNRRHFTVVRPKHTPVFELVP
jgi:predicted nucleic acid-binding protein